LVLAEPGALLALWLALKVEIQHSQQSLQTAVVAVLDIHQIPIHQQQQEGLAGVEHLLVRRKELVLLGTLPLLLHPKEITAGMG
jgi:hypothetical protein